MKLRTTILLVLAVLPWAGLHAQKTATFKVSATVVESCEVITRQAVLRATCTPAATYLIGLRNARIQMITGVGTGEPVEHTIFSAVPFSQVVPPVNSGDTASVRVYY